MRSVLAIVVCSALVSAPGAPLRAESLRTPWAERKSRACWEKKKIELPCLVSKLHSREAHDRVLRPYLRAARKALRPLPWSRRAAQTKATALQAAIVAEVKRLARQPRAEGKRTTRLRARLETLLRPADLMPTALLNLLADALDPEVSPMPKLAWRRLTALPHSEELVKLLQAVYRQTPCPAAREVVQPDPQAKRCRGCSKSDCTRRVIADRLQMLDIRRVNRWTVFHGLDPRLARALSRPEHLAPPDHFPGLQWARAQPWSFDKPGGARRPSAALIRLPLRANMPEFFRDLPAGRTVAWTDKEHFYDPRVASAAEQLGFSLRGDIKKRSSDRFIEGWLRARIAELSARDRAAIASLSAADRAAFKPRYLIVDDAGELLLKVERVFDRNADLQAFAPLFAGVEQTGSGSNNLRARKTHWLHVRDVARGPTKARIGPQMFSGAIAAQAVAIHQQLLDQGVALGKPGGMSGTLRPTVMVLGGGDMGMELVDLFRWKGWHSKAWDNDPAVMRKRRQQYGEFADEFLADDPIEALGRADFVVTLSAGKEALSAAMLEELARRFPEGRRQVWIAGGSHGEIEPIGLPPRRDPVRQAKRRGLRRRIVRALTLGRQAEAARLRAALSELPPGRDERLRARRRPLRQAIDRALARNDLAEAARLRQELADLPHKAPVEVDSRGLIRGTFGGQKILLGQRGAWADQDALIEHKNWQVLIARWGRVINGRTDLAGNEFGLFLRNAMGTTPRGERWACRARDEPVAPFLIDPEMAQLHLAMVEAMEGGAAGVWKLGEPSVGDQPDRSYRQRQLLDLVKAELPQPMILGEKGRSLGTVFLQ